MREHKKRSRYTNTVKKQRRIREPELVDQREPLMQSEPMDWDVTQERHGFQEYQGS